MTISFTNRNYVRSHARNPSSSTMGSWAFQASATDAAFDRDLSGPIEWVHMATLSEAKHTLRERGLSGLWAVLP